MFPEFDARALELASLEFRAGKFQIQGAALVHGRFEDFPCEAVLFVRVPAFRNTARDQPDNPGEEENRGKRQRDDNKYVRPVHIGNSGKGMACAEQQKNARAVEYRGMPGFRQLLKRRPALEEAYRDGVSPVTVFPFCAGEFPGRPAPRASPRRCARPVPG